MTQDEKIQEIKRLAAQKGVSDMELAELAAKQKKFDPSRFLDNTMNVLQTLQDVQKGVSGSITDKEGNLIGIGKKDTRPAQKIVIAGMSPPVFIFVSAVIVIGGGYLLYRYMKR